ncbi:hypothetical protein ABTH62_19910, partial [Acinetobacter baumannii]
MVAALLLYAAATGAADAQPSAPGQVPPGQVLSRQALNCGPSRFVPPDKRIQACTAILAAGAGSPAR